MKEKFKNMSLIDKIVKISFLILAILGLAVTLIYIFYTSTIILTSDSVITDVIAHQQKINNELLLSTWYYGNEFWFFSLSIPTLLLSFVIKNNIILRQVSVLLTAIIFFFLLYKFVKKIIGKRESIILLIVFLTGISYSVLDYFYAFNAYLTVIINSLILLYFYYKCFEEKNNKIYFILSIIFTFLINMFSLRYFPSVTISFILTEIIIIIINNKNSNIKALIKKENKNICRLLIIFLTSALALFTFFILVNNYHYSQRSGTTTMATLSGKVLVRDLTAVVKCINNFFGYDNSNHIAIFFTGKQYFVDNHRDYPIFSFFTFTNIIKIIMSIIVIIITPFVLFKNFNKNKKSINFLLIFNTISWLSMIYLYVFTFYFEYNSFELKYFLFNIIINIILSMYYLYKYIKVKRYIIDTFIIIYIISNIYTTILIIKDNNQKVMKEKYELVELLKKNNLSFGYGTFWNSLLTHYLSNYEITVAAVNITSTSFIPYRWYSDETWYDKKYEGRTFFILDQTNKRYYNLHKKSYPIPDETLKCKGFTVFVYNKNPFLDMKG